MSSRWTAIPRLIAGGLTGVVGETPVHHGHVGVLRGENSAPGGQQLLARRNSFEKRLRTPERTEGEGGGGTIRICCSCGGSDLQAVVTLQAVVGSHHHVPVPPLPGLIKEKEVLFIQNLSVLTSFLFGTQINKVGLLDRRQDSPVLHRRPGTFCWSSCVSFCFRCSRSSSTCRNRATENCLR